MEAFVNEAGRLPLFCWEREGVKIDQRLPKWRRPEIRGELTVLVRLVSFMLMAMAGAATLPRKRSRDES